MPELPEERPDAPDPLVRTDPYYASGRLEHPNMKEKELKRNPDGRSLFPESPRDPFANDPGSKERITGEKGSSGRGDAPEVKTAEVSEHPYSIRPYDAARDPDNRGYNEVRKGPNANVKATVGQSAMIDVLMDEGMSEQVAVAISSVSQKESGGDHTNTEDSWFATGTNSSGNQMNTLKSMKGVFGAYRFVGVTEKTLADERAKGKPSFEKFFWEQVYGMQNSKGQKLGNTAKGDGYKFRGRGLIQLTGKDNYEEVSQHIFGDDRLVKDPDLLLRDPVVAGKIAAWFITRSKHGKALLKDLSTSGSSTLTEAQTRELADTAYAIVAGGMSLTDARKRDLYPGGMKKQLSWLGL